MKTGMRACIAGMAFSSAVYGSAASLMETYRNAGAGPFSQFDGRAAWVQEYPSASQGGAVSCASCHGTDITQPGRHVNTGKAIAPMALSVNAERLTDPEKTEKWFRRNCRWTLGRECTPQEKGDFILFVSKQ
jgi:cytochrome c553